MKFPEIIYDDEDLVVVNKPPFFLTVPDRYAPGKKNLYAWITQEMGRKMYIVHRLDKETSGILVFAKHEGSHRDLSIQFEKREVSKTYLTLLDGVMHKDSGMIDKPIMLHANGKRMIVARKGKPSKTEYQVVKRYRSFTLVNAIIHTGRLHQIRVHFESIGYPLAVDAVYGRREGFRLSEIKGKKYNIGRGQEERPLISRVILHAKVLDFTHPSSGERMTFEGPLPKDFAAVVKQLDKWGG